ncbi:MAG: Hpt domain-containing protein [Pseudomonadota bacterium]
MSAAIDTTAEFDLGPLTWVKGEIDLALSRADQALQQVLPDMAGQSALTQLTFCRTHVHQVQGALTMLGLDGLTQFAEALEALLLAIEEQNCPLNAENLALASRAFAALRHYLDELMSGQANQPLRLLPCYREIQQARGQKQVVATDLFFPDLHRLPPQRRLDTEDDRAAQALSPAQLKQRLRQERARFQQGLLNWLRAPQTSAGVEQMLDAVRRIDATQKSDEKRAFWGVADGFLSNLLERAAIPESEVKALCARIDLQIRRLLEGSGKVAERLMRDVLYSLATTPSDHPAVQAIKESYQLQSVSASESMPTPNLHSVLLHRVRETIGLLGDAWNKFCAGTAQALPVFKGEANTLSALIEQLGHTDYRRLVQAIVVVANWLSERSADVSPAAPAESLAMEVATAILLSQNAQEHFQNLGGDFAHQVDVMVARLHSCIAGNPPAPGSEVPLLDEMSRRAQEKLLLAQVAKEIHSNLSQVEQVLDDFFREPTQRSALAELDTPLRQIIGALSVMQQDEAVSVLQHCMSRIKVWSGNTELPQQADFEQLADQLSHLGFFVDALAQSSSASDFSSFMRKMQAMPAAARNDSVESTLEQQKHDTHALLEAFQATPDNQSLRSEIERNLTTLQQDADLLADPELSQATKAVRSALAAHDATPILLEPDALATVEAADSVLALTAAPPLALETAIANLKPNKLETPAPSEQTMQLLQENDEVIDAELLAIFLEEANEVLATIGQAADELGEQTRELEALTTLRRAFHTLKGSGRMVGLNQLGELAWVVEQVLNLWLRREWSVQPPLLELIAEAQSVFVAWVHSIEQKNGVLPNTETLLKLAAALNSGVDEISALLERIEQVEQAEHSEAVSAPPAETIEQDDAADLLTAELDALSILAQETEADETDDLLLSAPDVLASLKEMPSGHEAEDISDVLPEPSLFSGNLSPLHEIFLPEARAHVSTLQDIFAAPRAPHEATHTHHTPYIPLPLPGEVSLAAHTLVGISGAVGLSEINQLAVALEQALLRRERGLIADSPETFVCLRQAGDALETMLSAVAAAQTPVPAHALVEALNKTYHSLPAPPVDTGLEAEPAPVPLLPLSDELTPESAAASVSVLQRDPAEQPWWYVDDEVDELDAQLLPIFLEEAAELNPRIAEHLRAWRSAPTETDNASALARLLHTLKGGARMAGAMNLGALAHAIESKVEQVVALAVSGATNQTASSPLLSARVRDEIDAMDSAHDRIVQHIDALQSVGSTRAPLAPDSAAALTPTPTQAANDAGKGVAPTTLAELPAASPASPASAAHVHAGGSMAAKEQPMLRVRAELLDRLVNEAGELSITRSRIEGEMRGLKGALLDLTENVIRLRSQLREIDIQAESQMQSRTARTGRSVAPALSALNAQADEQHPDFDPLEFDRFTRFQELTRMMAESVNDVSTIQQNLFKNLNAANAAILAQARLNRELQQQLMAVRMLPFSSLADRLYRVARQTAKELGKRANLEIVGGRIEVDRSVLEKIAAPLEHLLRNAIGHGLEAQATRLALGKPEIGEITLTLRQEGNELLLDLADDGAGLNQERIRARANAMGLTIGLSLATNPGDTPEQEAAQLAELIFTPGFSTATEVSKIAGRGVGMDVVKTEIVNLGGRIDVRSTPGQGASFRLHLPLTLAVTQALLVRVAHQVYALPSVMVEQVLDVKQDGLAQIHTAGAAEWMGKRYPFYFLPRLLGDVQAVPEHHRRYWILLLHSGEQRIAVQVDELKGNQEIVVKNIGAQLARVVGIDGATVLSDGQIILLLNPLALAAREQKTPTLPTALMPSPLATGESNVGFSALPTVMVVDDSLTVRKITERLLAREGYEVITAKDGVDALEKLLDVLPDVMLVDIEMPRMDGFDLTRNIRLDARLKNIPIIMITSRTADKHRNYAVQIGVNHYLGKPYPEAQLLELIAQHVRQQRAAQQTTPAS